MKLIISKNSRKFLEKIPEKHAIQITRKIDRLLEYPLDSILLAGHDSIRRAKAGEYRIIFVIESDSLNILSIGKRNDGEVYKRINR